MKTLHVKNLETLLKKVTLDGVIEFCQLNFAGGRVQTSIIATTRDVVIQADLPNNILSGIGESEELTLSFTDPHLRVIPQLKGISSVDIEEAEITISDTKMEIFAGQWGGGTIHFCDEIVLANHIMHRAPRGLEHFHQIEVTNNLHFAFNPVKAIAPGYGKIYFTVTDGELVLETGDKTNDYTDNYKVPVATGVEMHDVTVCFEFNNFAALMRVMQAEENKNYVMKFSWNGEEERGMIYAHTAENDENYYLISRDN